ncbi:MAG: squalene synthase HpnC [Rhodospirillaceae bacterium]|nr:MAG: squalene synthase HpnC [Rhodospirillaceae bacterium]
MAASGPVTGKALETPSGKGATGENFPVGSWLLPRRLRPHVMAFYGFARATDDIADNPTLSPEDKVTRLDLFAAALESGSVDLALAKADQLRRSCLETGVTTRHGLDLISAFKQDAVKNRYETWAELLDYCDRSAAPVGRFLIDLHGEDKTLYPFSDALCNALQVINHLQDCADDYAQLDRVYLPLAWMRTETATVEQLSQSKATEALRRVLDRALERTETLLAEARRLPGAMHHGRLAAESAIIVAIADSLVARLRHQDPLAGRVALGKFALAAATLRGLARLWL